jgi:hypothetical protein
MPWELVFSEKYEDFVLAKRRELKSRRRNRESTLNR